MKKRSRSTRISAPAPQALVFVPQITGRGFGLVRFDDRYGASCSLQKSSLATDEAIWLGVDSPNPVVMASQAHMVGLETAELNGWVSVPIHPAVHMTSRMHLTRDQVRELIPLLQRFADTGEVSL